MCCVRIASLTKNIQGGIENGNGSVATLGALYYFKDIERVMGQANFTELVEVNVIFERNNPITGEIKEITALGAKDSDGNFLDILALPWPSYYQRRPDHNGTEDFPGAENLTPGTILSN